MRACIGAQLDIDCAQGRPSTTRITAVHSVVGSQAAGEDVTSPSAAQTA
jgi:hypothetical protein